MKKALENLKKNNKNLNKGGITTSHLYIKFKPKNEEDISLLKIDSTLNLFNYPMDHMQIEGQDNYRDPEVPEDQPTYQYTSVKVDYNLPNVEYEILEELFIPEEIETNKNDNFYVDELVYEALKITNNLDKSDDIYTKRSRWRPAGRIRMWDNSLDRYVAPEGLKVRATRWFRTHRGFVNSEGYYSCDGRFRGKARYRIDWERHNFALRSGGFSSAEYRGPYKRGDWNWQIEDRNIHQYYGTIFRAAFHYYYQNNRGLRRPPENSFWRTQLRIGAFTQSNDVNGNHSSFWRSFGLWTPIKIYTFERSNEQTYATTIHELAHASHWNIDRSDFNDTDGIVKESWARGVEKELTSLIYGNLDYRFKYSRLRYTGIVEDLIDDKGKDNEVKSFYFWTEENSWNQLTRTYNDNVAGYSIRQLEDALVHKETWSAWEKSIGTINNPTRPYLSSSFDYWKTR